MNQEGTDGGGAAASGGNKKCRGQDAPPHERSEATKKLAQQGQWRTPPLPVFAAGAYVPPVTGIAPVTGAVEAVVPGVARATGVDASVPASKIPTTPDEYARMLQEAYKRGAEAGARAQKPAAAAGAAVGPNIPPPPVQYAATAAAPVRAPSVGGRASVPVGGRATGPSSGGMAHPAAAAAARPTHSKSLPNLSHYQAAAPAGMPAPGHPEDEEDKRKKRLARNRASARLRRLKKKNLVDSYEGEVGILEAALARLRAHRWGSSNSGGGGDDHEALVEALSMERGQQPLTPERRRELVQSIVAQQREQVANLLDCQLEHWMLSTLADSCGEASAGEGGGGNQPNEELDQVTSELRSVLNLTPDQVSRIQQSSRGCVHEVQDLYTVDDCLKSIQDNRWLLDEGVDEVAGQFTSVLNPSQLSKFLLWSDHNAEPIEKLDYVNVLPGVATGPVFEFGVDEGLADGD